MSLFNVDNIFNKKILNLNMVHIHKTNIQPSEHYKINI